MSHSRFSSSPVLLIAGALLAAGSSCGLSHPPSNAGPDAGAPLDAAPLDAAALPDDAGPDGGFVRTDTCPCESYCYEMRASTAQDLVVPPGEVWTRHGTWITRTVDDGPQEHIPLPEGDFVSVRLFGDDEPWIAANGNNRSDRAHGLFRWDGERWAEQALPPPAGPRVGRRLIAARAGERILASYVDTSGDALVLEDGEWTPVHPWGDEWTPLLVAGSADVLAVQVYRIEEGAWFSSTWARYGDGEWVELTSATETKSFALAVAGSLVAVPGFVYDGDAWFSLGEEPPRHAGVVEGTPWIVTETHAIDLSDPVSPVRHALPFAGRAAVFPSGGPLWIGGRSIAYWNGRSFTTTRALQPDLVRPLGVTGTPADFQVFIHRWGSAPVVVRRFRDGLDERRELPLHPWEKRSGGPQLVTGVMVEASTGEIFFGFGGGIGRSDGRSWLELYGNDVIDPERLDADARAYLAAGGGAVFAGIGREVYRWTGSAFEHELTVEGDIVYPLAVDERGDAWAGDTSRNLYERGGGGWERVPDAPFAPDAPSVYWAEAASGVLVVVGAVDPDVTEAAEIAAMEWDGVEWVVTPLPVTNFVDLRLTQRGGDVQVLDTRSGRMWARRGHGDWVEEAACSAARDTITTWWPEGSSRPWLLGSDFILRPRD